MTSAYRTRKFPDYARERLHLPADKKLLLFEDDEDTETVQVVTTVRCDPLSGRISCKAPLGKALLGHKAGDEVNVVTEEGGSYTVRIKSITKEEDNGDGPIL